MTKPKDAYCWTWTQWIYGNAVIIDKNISVSKRERVIRFCELNEFILSQGFTSSTNNLKLQGVMWLLSVRS